MRKFIVTLALALALVIVAPSPGFGEHRRHHDRHHYYTNVEGRRVHRPVRLKSVPAGATAQCNDGTFSFSQHHQGTCSHHGGREEMAKMRWEVPLKGISHNETLSELCVGFCPN